MTLLGDGGRRQMQTDGNYTTSTFVCSQIDDISATELMSTVQIDGESEESEKAKAHVKLYSGIVKCRRKQLKI